MFNRRCAYGGMREVAGIIGVAYGGIAARASASKSRRDQGDSKQKSLIEFCGSTGGIIPGDGGDQGGKSPSGKPNAKTVGKPV